MKKRIMILTMVLFAGIMQGMAQKQERQMKSPEERAQMITEKMTEKLSLTADQAKKVYSINLESAKRMQIIKENKGENTDKEAFKAQIKEVRTNQKAQINQVLTVEQKQKWEEIKAERKEKHGKHKGEYKKGHHKGEHKNGEHKREGAQERSK